MNDHKKPTPIIAERNERFCPICGKRSYSSGGTHPQCAVRREETKARTERLRAEKAALAQCSGPGIA
jgi:hypothetical protein